MEWYCLVTLTDLETRRTGLLVSAEVLVFDMIVFFSPSCVTKFHREPPQRGALNTLGKKKSQFSAIAISLETVNDRAVM